MGPLLNNATTAILEKMQGQMEFITIYYREIWNQITEGHTTIIVLVSIAIALILIMGVAILIRQRKIMKMLRDLTPPKAESPRKEEASAKETE